VGVSRFRSRFAGRYLEEKKEFTLGSTEEVSRWPQCLIGMTKKGGNRHEIEKWEGNKAPLTIVIMFRRYLEIWGKYRQKPDG